MSKFALFFNVAAIAVCVTVLAMEVFIPSKDFKTGASIVVSMLAIGAMAGLDVVKAIMQRSRP